MASYNPAEWADFFVATAGSAAALTGLLFVSISINLDRILRYPELPGRAGATLAVLVSLLLAACFLLAPGQTTRTLGVETLCLGAAFGALALWATVRRLPTTEPSTRRLYPVAIVLLPSIALIGGGVSLLARSGGGLLWILAAAVLTFSVGAINSWVLLVEIQR